MLALVVHAGDQLSMVGVGLSMLVVGFWFLIPMAVSAAVSLYNGHKSREAAKEAADAQVQGTKDAQKYIDTAYADAKSALGPYVQRGGQAVNALGDLMGLASPSSAPTATPAAATSLPVVRNQPLSNALGYNPRAKAVADSPTAQADLSGWREDRRADARDRRLSLMSADPTSMSAQTSSGYTTTKMKAPDGTFADVPSNLVDHYTQLGAQVVG